jgi:LPXTG-motif cell wall-anchored protein
VNRSGHGVGGVTRVVVCLGATLTVLALGAPAQADSASSATSTATGTVTGTVTDAATGRPVDQALVTLYRPTDPVRQPTALTGSDGRYSLTGPVGTWQVLVLDPLPEYIWTYLQRTPDGPTAQSLAPSVDLTADGTAVVDIALTAAGRIEGVVRDPDGRPVAGVRVAALSSHGDVWSSGLGTASAADGTFTLYEISPLPVSLRVCGSLADGVAVGCGGYVTVAPEQVVSGVVVNVQVGSSGPSPTTSPAPSCATGCAGAGGAELPKTGGGSAEASAVAGLALLLVGSGGIAVTRRR